ncbi:MAG: sulfatase [Armatimonadota bacterium]|nr:sulfatase [Armatimonadota bacterium]
MNIVLVILDTLRQDHVGAYGNDWIHTPHLDAFAAESVTFTRAYPESLPTLPVRRALHTGIRTYPFKNHCNYKGDFKGAPGWGPIPEELDTMPELLQAQGFRTAFITDTYHQFKPSKNFHRGFDEWIWIRGQEGDKFKSGPPPSRESIESHFPEINKEPDRLKGFLKCIARNASYRLNEKDYYSPQVFREASRWLWDNQDAEKFMMIVDSFDPHEPWDPPVYFRKLYDPDDDCKDVIHSRYGFHEGVFTPREMKRLQANYAGEVTMVDKWFGHFMENLRVTGRLKDTAVAVISDHGHNIGHDPRDKGLVCKQGHPMTRAVADLVLIVRHPQGEGAGTKCGHLVYNHDLTATLFNFAGVTPEKKIDGIDFWPTALGKSGAIREHVSVAWGPLVTVIDEEWWYNANVYGAEPLLYRYLEDPQLLNNLADKHPDICKKALKRAADDAGGAIPEYFKDFAIQPGCTPFPVKDLPLGGKAVDSR